MSEKNIRNCPWGYSCTKKWDDLIATSEEDIRFCNACQKEVHWVDDREELAECVLLNRCVCFGSWLIEPAVRESDQEHEGSITLMGLVHPDPLDIEPVKEGKRTQYPLDDFDDDIPF